MHTCGQSRALVRYGMGREVLLGHLQGRGWEEAHRRCDWEGWEGWEGWKEQWPRRPAGGIVYLQNR